MLSVILICPGLDHVRRGFETRTRECFDALSPRPDVEVTLCKGSGAPAPGEVVVRTVRRDRVAGRVAGRLSRTSGYYVEQRLFGVGVRDAIRARPGAVVMLSDWHLTRQLTSWRARSGTPFGLVFSNGGADSPPFGDIDQVLHPRPGLLAEALAAGEPPSRHALLPLPVDIEPTLPARSRDDVAALRSRYGLPQDRRVLLSVAAVNRQKRLDYVVREVAGTEGPRPFLMLVGQRDHETDSILQLADQLLGPDGYAMRTVPRHEVGDYYRAADAFVFAPLQEGLGRVLVEALGHGLPCLAHDWDGPRFVLADDDLVGDLTKPGALASLLPRALAEERESPRRAERHRDAYERFSWDRLADRYVEVLREAAPAREAVAA